jgi:hypothetical protein
MDHVVMLERRLEQLEIELAGMRRRSTRTALLSRVLACCAVVALSGALTLGTVTAATSPKSLIVKAPFQVVDSGGNVLMLVNASGVFFERGGQKQVQLGANEGGGGVCTFTSAGRSNGCLSSMADGGSQLLVGLPDNSHVQVGGAATGNMGVRVYKGQKEAAFIGAVATGGETALYKSGGENPSTILGAGPAGGYLQLQQQNLNPVAVISEDGNGGYFALMNKQGIARVEGGTTKQDQGVVRAFGPAGFNFILGRGGN